ncbi:hypothetical protein EJ05DRAFT_473744 [Pseudovirgaria hyperparasitica]|uniref:Uncharacterized protein n=1 Tax=Pseudovirgaria hyperparasitica TaxID=470096 RepID=A0A6A6WEQ9_9PEZI|nr:uncharacterized protein EJ05DRAFT_473744 [Pseudovirgaria hyperparasitica]KAF2761203.1 hypothetical protein EJ05DRAFT_473744 [Pseudovirgaria hyperparasitica]
MHLDKKACNTPQIFTPGLLLACSISLPPTPLLDFYPTPISDSAPQSYFTTPNAMDIDSETDSDDDNDVPMTPPPPQSRLSPPTFIRPTRPARLDAQKLANPAASTGRLPTPIAATNTDSTSLRPPLPRARTSPAPLRLPVRALRNSALAFDDTGLPSPISENEPTTPGCSAEMLLERMNVFGSVEGDARCAVPRRRMRSGAVSARGRWEEGRREDCERCRDGVKGHTGHFVAS